MNFSFNRQTAFLVASLIGLIALSVWFALGLLTLNAHIDFTKKEITSHLTASGKTRQPESISKDVQKIESGLAALNIFLPEKKQLAFITELESLAARNRVIQRLRLDVNNRKKTTWAGASIPFNISVIGSYTNGLEYLHDIEKLDYQLNITNIRINNLNTDEDRTKGVEFNLSGLVYRLE